MITETNVVGQATSEVTCQCARTQLHCPSCGRVNFYNVRSLAIRHVDKSIDRGFRCRSCGAEFMETSICHAPKVELSSKNQQLADAVREQAEDRSAKARASRLKVIDSLRALGRHQQADLAEKNLRDKDLI